MSRRVIPWVAIVLLSALTSVPIALGAVWVIPVAISAIAVLIAARCAYRRTGRLMEPGWLVGAVLFLYYELRIVVLLGSPGLAPKHDAVLDIYTGALLTTVGFVGMGAIVAVLTGYWAGGHQQYRTRSTRPDTAARFAVAGILYGMSFAAVIVKAQLGFAHYGGYSVIERSTSAVNEALTLLEEIGWLSYFYVVLVDRAVLHHAWTKAARILIVFLQLTLAFTAGGAAPFALWVTPFLLSLDHEASSGSKPARSVRRMLPVLAPIGLLFMLFAKDVSRQYLSLYGISPTVVSITQNLDGLPAAALATASNWQWAFEASGRFMGADSMAVIVSAIQSGDQSFLRGETLKLIPVAFIPRALWPGKPDIALGMYYTDNWWRGVRQVSEAGSGTQGTAFCLPGELYMNFGVPGVLIGMFLVGLTISFAYRRITARPMNTLRWVLLCFVFDQLIRWEFSAAAWIAGLVQSLLVFGVFSSVVVLVGDVLTGLVSSTRYVPKVQIAAKGA
jgi:hypothetical protein